MVIAVLVAKIAWLIIVLPSVRILGTRTLFVRYVLILLFCLGGKEGLAWRKLRGSFLEWFRNLEDSRRHL